MSAMTRAFLGLGSNLGDREAYLRQAVESLDGVVRTSSIYETGPVGGPQDQPLYLNMVVELDTDLTPRELLAECRRLEEIAQRVRIERWGPRTLDVDILLMDGIAVDEPDLQVPHPRMLDRSFVMVPLAEIAPDVVPDGWEARAEGEVRRFTP